MEKKASEAETQEQRRRRLGRGVQETSNLAAGDDVGVNVQVCLASEKSRTERRFGLSDRRMKPVSGRRKTCRHCNGAYSRSVWLCSRRNC